MADSRALSLEPEVLYVHGLNGKDTFNAYEKYIQMGISERVTADFHFEFV